MKAFGIMKMTWKQRILLAITDRHVLILFNLILIVIIISIAIDLVSLLKTPENDIDEMIDMCNGIAIILYGYGVALRARRELMNYLNLYPAHATGLQTGIDGLCQKYGLFFILLGLAQEILVHIIIIPNRVLNTEGKESYIFAVSLIIQVVLSVLLVRASILLLLRDRLIRRGRGTAASTVGRIRKG
jgi:uncharacterized Tic20 family protein